MTIPNPSLVKSSLKFQHLLVILDISDLPCLDERELGDLSFCHVEVDAIDGLSGAWFCDGRCDALFEGCC